MGTDTRGEDKQKIRIEPHTFMGSVWFAGWLFTIGFLHLTFWKGFSRLRSGLTISARTSVHWRIESAGYPERNKAPVGVKL